MRTKNYLLLVLVALSILVSIYEGLLYWYDLETSESLLQVCHFIFIVLLVFWVDSDSKDHPEIYRPYEYRYLMFLFWPVYLPYYFCRTRGAFGLLALSGFAGLFLMSYLVQWVIYAALTTAP